MFDVSSGLKLHQVKPAPVRLEILVCTHGTLDRVSRMTMPRHQEVRWSVSCQTAKASPQEKHSADRYAIPEPLRRDDITIDFIAGRGAGANRNHLLDCATGQYIVMADDDVTLDIDKLLGFADDLDRDPECDFIVYRVDIAGHLTGPAGECEAAFGTRPYLYATPIAMIIRRERLGTLRFVTDMGLGTDYVATGEDDVFYHDMLLAGLRGRYVPVAACLHPDQSTNERPPTPGMLRGRGYVLAKIYGRRVLVHLLRMAFVIKGNPVTNMRHLLQGRRYYLSRLNQ